LKSYEEIIKDYVTANADVLNRKASSKKRLIKFSEAISRAIAEKKKSDTGYGILAENLASIGLSGSGYADYLMARGKKNMLTGIENAAGEKELSEASDDILFREEAARLEAKRLEEEKKLAEEKRKEQEKLEAERLKEEERLEKEKLAEEKRLEKERLEAEAKLEKEAKEREKLKNTVASFAKANNVTDYSLLLEYALSIGLSEDDAKEVCEKSVTTVREKIRTKNIEKARDVIISERLTKPQAYAYALHIGLSEEDATELSEFAYKMNQDTDYITGNESGTSSGNVRPPNKKQNTTVHIK